MNILFINVQILDMYSIITLDLLLFFFKTDQLGHLSHKTQTLKLRKYTLYIIVFGRPLIQLKTKHILKCSGGLGTILTTNEFL